MTFELTRRQFLVLTAAAGSAALFVPFAWQVLAARQRRTLVEVARVLFPRQGASDLPYLRAVAAIDRRCRHDRAARTAVLAGVADLERACGEPFENASEHRQVELLKAREGEAFYWAVYGEALESLFGAPDAWLAITRG